MSALRDWLASRTPAPPEALLLPVEDAFGDLVATLADAGALALERALTGQASAAGLTICSPRTASLPTHARGPLGRRTRRPTCSGS